MRISDWSSDVCSSDLHLHPRNPQSQGADVGRRRKTLRSAYYGADYWPFGDWNANRFGWLAKSYRESFGSSIRRSRSYAGSGKHSCCCVAEPRYEEQTSELHSPMRREYALYRLTTKNQ